MFEILLRDKRAFAQYVFASTLFVTEMILFNVIISLIAGVAQTRNLTQLWLYFGLAVLILAYSAGIFLVSRFLRLKFMRNTILYIREKAFDVILSKNYRSFGRKLMSEYISNLVNDINTFESQFFYSLLNVISNGVTYLFSLIILLVMDPFLGLGMFAVSMTIFGLTHLFQKRTVQLQENVQRHNERFTVNVSNTFSGLEIVKLNSIEDRFLKTSLTEIGWLERKKFHFAVFTYWQGKFSEFLGTIVVLGILFYITGLLDQGYSLARIMFLIQLSNALIWPITEIVPLYNTVKANSTIIGNILRKDPVDGTLPATTRDTWSDEGGIAAADIDPMPVHDNRRIRKHFDFNDRIQMDHLRFSHEEKTILNNVNFTIERGKKYLVRGPSGAGKSTLINLLSKVYEDYEGSIFSDGIEFREIDETSFNEKVAFIHQDVFLFEDSLKENITLYRHYSDVAIHAAVRGAGLSGLIDRTEAGLAEPIEENGKNLSGGERQRISIARAIIREPHILFADEITSAMDETLGGLIEQTLLNLNTTVISISHRFYPGISDQYDAVLEVAAGKVTLKSMNDYLQEMKP
jgi:ABC-type multidrug transport system fused ATPase/permease subunit